MKKVIILLSTLVILSVLPFLTGCEKVPRDWEEGKAATRTFDFEDFTVIDVGYAFHLEVIPSDEYSITITAGENVFERLDVKKSGNTLEIGFSGWWFNIRRGPEAVIKMPVLEGLKVSGASQVVANGFTGGEEFNADVSGASDLEMDIETDGPTRLEVSGASGISGSLTAASTEMEVSGASNVNLEGTGGDGKLHISGASTGNLYDFPLEDTSIDLSGASSARLNVNGRLDVDVSGASTLRYDGDPTLRSIEMTGGSTVERR